MKCEIIQDLLPLFVDDICSNVTREEIEAHLHTCEGCRQKEKELRAEFVVAVKEPLDMDKKEIIQKREKAIITAVNERLLRLVAKFDTVVTSTVILFLFGYSMKTEGLVPGIIKAVMSTPYDGVPAGGILIVFLVFDGMYLVNGKKDKNTFVSGSLVIMSVVVKVMVILILSIYLVL